MIIKCITTKGYWLPRKAVLEGSDRIVDYHEWITLNKEYNVYGISIFDEDVTYLILDRTEKARWYKAELFEIIDTWIPNNWHHKFYGYDNYGLTAKWSYYEQIDEKHHIDLLEREREAEYIFYKRRKEIDKEIELRKNAENSEELKEFYNHLSRDGEIEFEYNKKKYSITHSDNEIYILELNNDDTLKICNKPYEVGEYIIDGKKLKDIFTQINIIYRCFGKAPLIEAKNSEENM